MVVVAAGERRGRRGHAHLPDDGDRGPTRTIYSSAEPRRCWSRAILADTRVLVWLNVLLVAQFANLFALYGFGLNDLSSDALGWLLPNYTPTARFVSAIVSVACWLALLWVLGRTLERRAGVDVARRAEG